MMGSITPRIDPDNASLAVGKESRPKKPAEADFM
jgi:hypothetical protein